MFSVAVLITGRFLTACNHHLSVCHSWYLSLVSKVLNLESLYILRRCFFNYRNTDLRSTSGDPIIHPPAQIAVVEMTVIHDWCLAGLFSGISCDEEPRSSPDICSYILFFSFSLLLKIFLLLNLPCYTSSLSLFAACTIKEQIVLFLLLHNHFWCTLEYIGITLFFWHTLFLLKSCDKWFKVQQHYTILNFLLQISTNGSLPSSFSIICACFWS